MSDKDRPSNPFGRGDRTIIRPNPGGRLPPNQPPANPTPQPIAPAGTESAPYGSPPSAPLQPAERRLPRAPTAPSPPFQSVPQSYAPAPATQAPEEWISTPTRPPAPLSAGPSVPAFRIDDLVAPNANPILRAAGPLLLLLGRLRVAQIRASFSSLMEQVANAIAFFERDVRSAGISEQQANSAKYILCATADDIVQHIPTDDRHVWTQHSMLSRFFGERVGGVRFFEILNHHKLDPLINYPVLELLHTALALGFQGMYRAMPNGISSLQLIQRDLYETLRRVRPKMARDLSPRWQGQALAMNSSRIRVPVWIVGSLAGVLLFALFVTLRVLLSGSAETAAAMTTTLHSSEPFSLQRRVIETPLPPPQPPPPPPPPDDFYKPPSDMIGDCKITIKSTANQHVIRVCGSITFVSGSDSVLDQFKPVAAQIANALNGQPGQIKVVGYTDNDPVGYRWKSNYELSLARANKVANLIKSGLSDPNRVVSEGKGADSPIGDNKTPEGRASNRRVEVVIARAPNK